MSKLTKRVESKISRILPDKFVLLFDGWTENGTHFMAIFASYPSDTKLGYATNLLDFSPFEDETSQGTDNHDEYTNFVL